MDSDSGRGNERDERERSPRPLTRLRAGREPGDDLLSAVAIVAVCALVPLFIPERYAAHLALYIGRGPYVAIATVWFGLASWLLVEGLEIDRVTFAGSAVLTPWAVVIALPVLLPGRFEHLFTTVMSTDAFFRYPFAIGAAGVTVVGLSLLSEQLSIRYTRVPGRRRTAFAVGSTAILGVGTVAGVRYARPPAASIESVTVDTEESNDTNVFVSVEAETTALHVAVTDPSGAVWRRRIREFDLEHGPVRVGVPERDDSSVDGRYEVELVSARGRTVDSTTVRVRNGAIVEE